MRRYLLPGFLVLLDILIIISAAVASLYLRLPDMRMEQYLPTLFTNMPRLIFFIIGSFVVAKIYNRIWRYAGIKELIAIVVASLCGVALAFFHARWLGDLLPRSVYVMVFFFVVSGVSLSRLLLRYFVIRAESEEADSKRLNVLIVGAGDAGNIIAREIGQRHGENRRVVAYMDDDPAKVGNYINGVKVYGRREDIPKIVDKCQVQEIVIAIPSLHKSEINAIANICNQTKCEVKILPEIYSLLDDGQVSYKDLRPLNIEDLLQRDAVELDVAEIGKYLTGKTVLVTGAGGSIGSELCRQIMTMQPKLLVLLGKGENSIYEIHQELMGRYDKEKLVPVIANVANKARLEMVFAKYHPQVVFHAAAHKHVPLMEAQPREAILNNVFGSWNVGKLAGEYCVEKMVMISTDKAVNPTSVMGATKRVAEKIMQALNQKYTTKYVAVRFGNVLGSRGSVVPLFKKQIAKGGPVTVTDPEMKRYFMTIPEASRLVMQAGSMGRGGEVFVLDMGEPVKIVDLARNMIRLSGLEPEKDIEIKFTGLRPGEKLFEELLTAEEGTVKTTHKKIFQATLGSEDPAVLKQKVEAFDECLTDEAIIEHLQTIVPMYTPNHFAG